MGSNEKNVLDLGFAIKLYRKTKGVTQKQVAEACGTTSRIISRMERGKGYKMMQIPLLLKVAKHLEMPDTKILESLGMKSFAVRGPEFNLKKKSKGVLDSKRRRLIAIGLIIATVATATIMLLSSKAFSKDIFTEQPIIEVPIPTPDTIESNPSPFNLF